MENDASARDLHPSWGRWLGEHAIGTVIMGSAVAGLVGVWSLAKGKHNILADMKMAGAFGALGSLGFGRTVYNAYFNRKALDSTVGADQDSWQNRIQAERSRQGGAEQHH